jgi:hypothetical protein
MRGSKTIEFDFDITYSKGGQFVTTRQITVREPGLGKYDVHATMTAFVSKAALSFSKLAKEMRGAGGQQPEQSEPSAPPADDDDQDVMQLMAMGLGIDEFPKFATYVKKAMTGSPRVATVGEGTDQAITEEVWESLDQNGGMEAVNKVMSEFTGFFFEALNKRQAKRTGAATSATSSSPTKAPSPMTRRANSRLPS